MKKLIIKVGLYIAVMFNLSANTIDQERLNKVLAKVIEYDLAPNFHVAITTENETVYQMAFGYADAAKQVKLNKDHQYYIASTTKSFVGLASAMLNDEQILPLSLSLGKILPEMKLGKGLNPFDISLQDLITCTHGIGYGPIVMKTAYTGEYDYQELIRIAKYHNALGSGKQFEYSNLGYNIYSTILHEKFDIDWKDLVSKKILEPAGMLATHSRFENIAQDRLLKNLMLDHKGFREVEFIKTNKTFHAAGGHVSTVEDLTRWLRLNINKGKIEDKQVIPEHLFTYAHKEIVEQQRSLGAIKRHAWGLGWDIGTYKDETLIHRPGSHSGFFSQVAFMPNKKLGFVVLSNGGWPTYRLNMIIGELLFDLAIESPLAFESFESKLAEVKANIDKIRKRMASRIQTDSITAVTNAKRFTGKYFNDGYGEIDWSLVDNNFSLKMGGVQSKAYMRDENELLFAINFTGYQEQVEFVEKQGEITGFYYLEQFFKKIR